MFNCVFAVFVCAVCVDCVFIGSLMEQMLSPEVNMISFAKGHSERMCLFPILVVSVCVFVVFVVCFSSLCVQIH